MNRGRSKRGFSILELALVAAIIALMGLIAVPKIQEAVRMNQIRGEVRRMASAVAEARAAALERREIAAGVRSESAGLDIVDDRNYFIYLSDTADGVSGGTELNIRVFQIPETLQLEITTSPDRVRFRRTGVLDTATPNTTDIELVDNMSKRRFAFTISATGLVRMR
ncbi:MAG: type II secretion system protein [Deltaproteobacteria bacterium]|nr:type II secretion system protein [Deltaproteobacteria bacterium]